MRESAELSHPSRKKKKLFHARNRTYDGAVMLRSERELLADSATDDRWSPVISKALSIYHKHLKDRVSKNALGNNVMPIAAS